jgi:hypothetical protein
LEDGQWQLALAVLLRSGLIQIRAGFRDELLHFCPAGCGHSFDFSFCRNPTLDDSAQNRAKTGAPAGHSPRERSY